MLPAVDSSAHADSLSGALDVLVGQVSVDAEELLLFDFLVLVGSVEVVAADDGRDDNGSHGRLDLEMICVCLFVSFAGGCLVGAGLLWA